MSALDVSVQAQIMNLFMDLRRDFDLTFVFIAHDLAVVRHFADTVAVMHQGRVVEQGESQVVLAHPSDPYTQALLDADPTC